MDIKYTPWRMAYITGTDTPGEKAKGEKGENGCVLCALPGCDPSDDAEYLLLCRGRFCYVVMNRYPYNNGHLMVVPYRHTADLVGLDDGEAQELFALTRRCVAFLHEEYQPHGFNLGMNLGRVAGAGIDEHLHMHIVPRWSGDVNFMPLIGDTKLVPENLEQTYARLRPRFEQRSIPD